MAQKITTFFMFDKGGKEAVDCYVSLFKNSKITNVQSMPPAGQLFNVTFELDGVEFMAMDGGEHFKFTEGMSQFVSCKDQAEVDHFWNGFLEAGGQESMCGWLTDKWGVSWQIIPEALGELMGDEDSAKVQRVVQAMLKMKKIIVADLQAAYDGK